MTRIDPGTNSTRQIAVGEEPVAVAADEQAVWVANAGDGTVFIDPVSADVVRTIEVGGHRPAARARARLGDAGVHASGQTGRQNERGPEQLAADPCREERRLVEDEKRNERSGVS